MREWQLGAKFGTAMCGLNGIFAYHPASGFPKNSELLATRDAMRARGPDGSGAWWSPSQRCGLAHRRLAILDLSDRASQPMISEDGQFVLVFNGEIYNYLSLRAGLEVEGVRFRTTSDTEVLLHLYSRHGAAMVHKLRGMFAFAIWDEMRSGLFLARDAYGIKPLYTANDGWTFRFSSQVKALLAGGEISRDPEPAGIVGFHLFGSVPEPFTIFRDIRALPAGHTQWVDATGPRESRPFVRIAEILAAGNGRHVFADELHASVRSAALESVRAHLVADVEVGLFLSAGVDSGALLGLMRDAGQRQIRAITLAFEEFRGTDEDEAPIAARVAQRYDAKHIIRMVTENEFREDLPKIFDAMDQPSIDGINTWFVAKAAKEAGLKVAISGLGGDELLAGYPSFVDVPRWLNCYGPIAKIPGLARLARSVIRAIAPELVKSQPKVLGLLQYADSIAGAYLLRRGLFLPHELPDILGEDLAREGMRRLLPLRVIAANLEPDPSCDIARICALESSLYMRNQLLRDADWAGMAHGIEIRVPLVDTTLLRSLAPAIGCLSPGVGKTSLAMAPALPLPDEITNRAKTGFGVPFASWMADATGENKLLRPTKQKGVTSRRWLREVFATLAGDLNRLYAP